MGPAQHRHPCTFAWAFLGNKVQGFLRGFTCCPKPGVDTVLRQEEAPPERQFAVQLSFVP